MQIGRLFETVYILLNKKSVTAKELAVHFGVSRRTICRDIDTLSAAGIPIYSQRGKGGGIRLLPGFVLNRSLLSEPEQNEVLAALHGLSSIKADDTGQILQKLSALFNKPSTNWMQIDFAGWAHENDYFNQFKAAILERRVVEFNYFNAYGGKTFRRVEPVQVWFKSKSWYLKGFCLTKQEMRLYKVSRIKNLTVTNDMFAERDTPALLERMNTSSYETQYPVIKLRIQPEMAYRVFDDFYESMIEKQPDGSFIASVAWPEDNWLYGFILSFGKHIEVIEPAHIRAIIKDEAQKIYEQYL